MARGESNVEVELAIRDPAYAASMESDSVGDLGDIEADDGLVKAKGG